MDLDGIIDKLIRAQGALSTVETVARTDRDRLMFAIEQIQAAVVALHASREKPDAA